jgi:uncharacterized protein
VCTVAFVWVRLGLGLGATGCMLVSVAMFVAQVTLAWTWLQRFRFGPLERIWRCATYGEIIAMQRPRGVQEVSARSVDEAA